MAYLTLDHQLQVQHPACNITYKLQLRLARNRLRLKDELEGRFFEIAGDNLMMKGLFLKAPRYPKNRNVRISRFIQTALNS